MRYGVPPATHEAGEGRQYANHKFIHMVFTCWDRIWAVLNVILYISRYDARVEM